MQHFIYTLADPRTDVVAYVGITSNAYNRFRQHITRHNRHPKDEWIQQLQDDKVAPAMKIIEIVDTLEQAKEREVYWIHYYLEHGVTLHNLRIDDLDPIIETRPKPVLEPAPIMKTRVKYWRSQRTLSIKMLAERAEIAPATIVNIEKQKHIPNPETLHKLAKALQISVEQLLDEEERPVLIA